MNCKICKEILIKPIEIKESMFGTWESFKYAHCAKCKCLQIIDIPANLQSYYKSDYYSWSQLPQKPNNKEISKLERSIASTTFNPHDRYSFFGTLKIAKEAKILDIGCGNGFFLFPLQYLGYKNLTGLDPFIEKNIHYSESYKVLKDEISNLKDQYDFIFLNHSFEHIPDQNKTMSELKKILNPNGAIILRVPLSDGFAYEEYQQFWWQLDPPRHLYLHSKGSIQFLADQSQLKVSKIIYDSTDVQFLHSELIKQGHPIMDHHKVIKKNLKTKMSKVYNKYRANKLNKKQKGDQAAFIITHA